MKAINMNLRTTSVPKETRCRGAERILAKSGSAKTAKVLVPTLPVEIQKELDAIRARARNHHLYRFSLPLRSSDGHVVPGEYVEKVVIGVGECEEDWQQSVQGIKDDYAGVKHRAEKAAVEALNTLLSDAGEDPIANGNLANLGYVFPSQLDLEQAFSWTLTMSGLEDFAAGAALRGIVGESVAEEVQAQLEERQNVVLREIALGAAVRISKLLDNVFKRLSTGGVFRDSLTGNIQELVDLLPGLNMNNDPVIDGYVEELREMFRGIDAESLRDDDGKARELAGKSRDFLETISGDFPEADVKVPEVLPELPKPEPVKPPTVVPSSINLDPVETTENQEPAPAGKGKIQISGSLL